MSAPVVVDGLLLGASPAVAAWVQEHIPGCQGFGPCSAIGIVRDDRIVGGVVFHSWRPHAHDIEVAGAVAPGFRLGPGGLRRVLRYAFGELDCRRLTIRTGKRNKAARAFAERLGFQLEGTLRHALDGRQHLVVYGLVARDCRFLKETA